MAPKSPWNKKATTNKNAQKNANTAQAASSAINYAEVQAEEVEVVKAIYMDEYEEVEVKGPWKSATDRSFKLKLRSSSDEKTCVVLSVRLTATYPKSAPLLNVQGLESHHERTQTQINTIVTKRPTELLGEVMIHTIASEIQDALEDAVQARQQGTLPSLNDERASAEEMASKLAQQAQDAEIQRQLETKAEEDRALTQMVDEEVQRREKRRPSRPTMTDSAVSNAGEGSNAITFDQVAMMQVEGATLQFNTVTVITALSSKRDQQLLLAKPRINDAGDSPLVAVKRMSFQKSRDEVLDLEAALASTTRLRHACLLSIFAYRIDKLNDAKSEMILCSEYADRGTLKDLLDLGNLSISKARQFTVQLLEGLDYLHRNGMAHGRLRAKSVAIAGTPSPTPKLTDFVYTSTLFNHDEHFARWPAPESGNSASAAFRKSDIWHLGEVICEMFLGPDVVGRYSSPQLLLARLDLSESFDDLLRKTFTVDYKKRPSAFELLPAGFLRTNDPVMDDAPLSASRSTSKIQRMSSSDHASPSKHRSRHDSSSLLEPVSRYAADFTEMGRLGKGGYGEVVKARNKLDGGVYAVKKIKQAAQLLDKVISEVVLLNRLNHPYVVRYFSTWIEEDSSGMVLEESSTETESTTDAITEDDAFDGPRIEFGYESAGGLDFVSSSGFPHIEFGNDSSDEDDGDTDDGENAEENEALAAESAESPESSDNGDIKLKRTRSDSQRAPSTLYIQMEYCERRTLRDIIRKTMDADESWRYIRQITEGLAHIHSNGIIHRDLKPDNVFIDVAGNPKIGDFGLATTGQQHIVDNNPKMSGYSAGEMTRSVGTTLYVAPELHSGSGSSSNEKVDMYSLGIMFYEMCQPFSTSMERIEALQHVRDQTHELPATFRASGEKAAQGKVISCLISHKPSERLSSTELLRSDMLPLKIEDETIRKAMSSLSDPRSPNHQKMMSALFAHDPLNTSRVRALAWDAKSSGLTEDNNRLRLRSIARHTLETVFRRHGAEEARRQTLFPRSGYYTNNNPVQVLDASGNLLQLPYDLVLPRARQLARQHSDTRCTFTFGQAYRDALDGGPPRVNEEVDFDITKSDDGSSSALDDAEMIKVMDEVTCEMPLFAASITVSFHLNHSGILDAILEFCRVPLAQHTTVKEMISKLGSHQHNWSKVRVDLRKFGLPDTTLDDLHQFDFRDLPKKAFSRLKTLFDSANSKLRTKLNNGIQLLDEILDLISEFNVTRKVYVAPLSCANAKFYDDGMLFQCVLERKTTRTVIAAGGRYDSLIRALCPVDSRMKPQGAVGVSIGLEPIVLNMARNREGTSKRASRKQDRERVTDKRCTVLVTATGSRALELAGIKILTMFWESDISAELASSSNTRTEDYNFIVTLKHEASNSAKVFNTETDAEEADVPMPVLVSHIQQELRERESGKHRQPSLLRQASHPETERKSNVHVLIAKYGSKKSNKYQVVNDAQEHWSRKLEEAKNAPILAVETRDDVLDLVQQTKLSDAESWRKAVQGVLPNDRQYLQQIHEMLTTWRKKWTEDGGTREACVFNFRTQHCIYYDLGL